MSLQNSKQKFLPIVIYVLLALPATSFGFTVSYATIATVQSGISKKDMEYTMLERESINRYTKALALQLYHMKNIIYSLHTEKVLPIIMVEPEITSLPSQK